MEERGKWLKCLKNWLLRKLYIGAYKAARPCASAIAYLRGTVFLIFVLVGKAVLFFGNL